MGIKNVFRALRVALARLNNPDRMGQKSFPSPVVAVCGATGTGKSRLAIEIASIFGGQVINSDAIQLYEGLSIATNKVTDAEMAGIPHHLLGCFPFTATNQLDVHKYRAMCWPLIDEMRSSHMPVLVGGTHYYLEAILWSDFLASGNSIEKHASSINLPSNPTDCYAKLKELDPITASRLHPNDIRKVRRALQKHLTLTQAPILPSQSHLPNDPPNRSYHPRYPDQTIIFWLDCDQTVLISRLDNRVDDMLQRGLVDELERFLLCSELATTSDSLKMDGLDDEDRAKHLSRLFTESSESTYDPYTRRGILQAIGFKEFTDYLTLPRGADGRDSTKGQEVLNKATERVKFATRQYARRQVKWISNRYLKRPSNGSLPVYRLDVTETLKTSTSTDANEVWNSQILAPACRILYDHLSTLGAADSWISSSSLTFERLTQLLSQCPAADAPKPCKLQPLDVEQPHDKDSPTLLVCPTCGDRQFTRRADLEAHNRSRGHSKRLAKLRRRALLATDLNPSPLPQHV